MLNNNTEWNKLNFHDHIRGYLFRRSDLNFQVTKITKCSCVLMLQRACSITLQISKAMSSAVEYRWNNSSRPLPIQTVRRATWLESIPWALPVLSLETHEQGSEKVNPTHENDQWEQCEMQTMKVQKMLSSSSEPWYHYTCVNIIIDVITDVIIDVRFKKYSHHR